MSLWIAPVVGLCGGINNGIVCGAEAVALQESDQSNELQLLDNTLQQDPSDRNSRRRRADLLQREKRYQEALKDLGILVTQFRDEQALFDRGWLLSSIGEHQSAIKDFTAFMKQRQSKTWAVLYARAKCYFALADYKRCLVDCTDAINEQECRQTLLLRASAFEKLKEVGRAAKDRHKAASLEDCPELLVVGSGPSTSGYFLSSARRCAKNGQWEESLATIALVLTKNPTRSEASEAYMIRAQIHENNKEMNKAVKDLSKAIVAEPNDALPYSRRADLYMRLDQPVRALSDYEKCVSREPDNDFYRQCRAFVRLKLENFQGAVDDCTASLEKKPSTTAYELRARAFEKLRNEKAAQNDRMQIRKMIDALIPHSLALGEERDANSISLPADMAKALSIMQKDDPISATAPANQGSSNPVSTVADQEEKVLETHGNLRTDAFGAKYYDVNTIVNSNGRIDLAEPGKPFGSIRLYRVTRDGKRLPEE